MWQYVCEELNVEKTNVILMSVPITVYVEYILIYSFSSITQTIKFGDGVKK